MRKYSANIRSIAKNLSLQHVFLHQIEYLCANLCDYYQANMEQMIRIYDVFESTYWAGSAFDPAQPSPIRIQPYLAAQSVQPLRTTIQIQLYVFRIQLYVFREK
jgi:hypothetical protein